MFTRIVFRYSYGFYLFPVLVRILPFFGTHTDSTLLRYLLGQFLDTRTDSTFSLYSPGFYHFSVLTLIRPFSRTCRDTFSTLARILPFPGTDPNYAIFRYSHIFDPFSVLLETVFRYSYGFYLSRYSSGFYHFSVLTQIRPFSGTCWDSF